MKKYWRKDWQNATRTTCGLVEFRPTGEESWGLLDDNAFKSGIKKYYVYAHEGAKRSFNVWETETEEQEAILKGRKQP